MKSGTKSNLARGCHGFKQFYQAAANLKHESRSMSPLALDSVSRAIQSATKGLSKKPIAIVLIVGIFLLIAYYLYLTKNRYYIMTTAEGIAYEVDRQTGHTWSLYGATKSSHQEDLAVNRTLEAIPSSEVSKITGNALLGSGFFKGTLYNGSDWTLKEVVFMVTAKEEDGSIRWSRQFKHEMTIVPLVAASFSVYVDGGAPVASNIWQIDEARGYRGD